MLKSSLNKSSNLSGSESVCPGNLCLTSLNNESPHKESANYWPSVHLNFLQLQKKTNSLRMPQGLVRVTGSSEGLWMA